MTDSRPLSYLSAGHKLGKYEIKKLIGRGGMAEVYQAFNPDLHVDVAIKILYPQTAESEKAIQRFRHEARAIAALNHANIVRTFDFDTFENLNYMVMELVEGPSLKDVISRFPQGMPVHQALELFHQIADAVTYAHDHNVIHRDLKPGNILIAKDGRPLLTDFGLALIGGNVRLTGTEVSIGTPQYMSPEQAQGTDVGPQTDIYSLGVILYEMLVGDVPFQGDSFSQILLKLLQEKPKLPSRIVPNIDPQIDHVVERALAKSPRQRFLSVRDMLMDLGLDTPRSLTFDLLEGVRASKGEAVTPAPPSTHGSSGSRTLTRSAQLLRTTTTGIKNNPILSVGVLLTVVLGALGAAITAQLRSLAPTVSANSTPTVSLTPPDGMAYIPGGRFKMGSAQGTAPESPPHDIDLTAYFIDRTEVTNKQYLDFVVQTGYAPPRGWQQKSANWVIEGTRGFVIGTPQDRFSYDGKLVLPIQGNVRFDLNSVSKTGEVIAEFTGTLQIRFGSVQTGRWRIVHNKFSSEQTFYRRPACHLSRCPLSPMWQGLP